MATIPGAQLPSHTGDGHIVDFVNEHGQTIHSSLITHDSSQRDAIFDKRVTEYLKIKVEVVWY